MEYFHQRLRRAMDARAINTHQLAHRSGLDYGNLHRVLNGVNVPMTFAMAMAALSALPEMSTAERLVLLDHALIDRVIGEIGAYVIYRLIAEKRVALLTRIAESVRDELRAQFGTVVRFGKKPITIDTIPAIDLLEQIAREPQAKPFRDRLVPQLIPLIAFDLRNGTVAVSSGPAS